MYIDCIALILSCSFGNICIHFGGVVKRENAIKKSVLILVILQNTKSVIQLKKQELYQSNYVVMDFSCLTYFPVEERRPNTSATFRHWKLS